MYADCQELEQHQFGDFHQRNGRCQGGAQATGGAAMQPWQP